MALRKANVELSLVEAEKKFKSCEASVNKSAAKKRKIRTSKSGASSKGAAGGKSYSKDRAHKKSASLLPRWREALAQVKKIKRRLAAIAKLEERDAGLKKAG